MRMSEIKGIGQYGEDVSVSEWKQIPGQTSGLAQYSPSDDAVDGLSASDYDDALDGLAQAGDDEALFGLGGLGQAFQWQQRAYRNAAAKKRAARKKQAQKGGLMQAIISTSRGMKSDVARANLLKLAAARKNPLVAQRLAAKARKTAVPGTSVQRAVVGAFGTAAKVAKQAQASKVQAAAALRAGDKQKAASKTIKYFEQAKKASTLAMRAEKTRLATASDKLAKTFDAQAKTLEMAAKKQIAKTGPSPLTDRLMAQAQQTKMNAAKMRANAAVVARTPNTAPGLPSPQRMAELANKFNIRTARRKQIDQRTAMIAVLSDLSDSALAQADDYEGALSYYGADAAGKMMADIEYGNLSGFIAGLEGMDGLGSLGFGFDDIVSGFKKAKDAVTGAVDSAKKTYESVKGAVKSVMPGAKPPEAAKPPAMLPPTPPPGMPSGGAAGPSMEQMKSGGGETPFYKNPMVLGGAAVVLLGGAYLAFGRK